MTKLTSLFFTAVFLGVPYWADAQVSSQQIGIDPNALQLARENISPPVSRLSVLTTNSIPADFLNSRDLINWKNKEERIKKLQRGPRWGKFAAVHGPAHVNTMWDIYPTGHNIPVWATDVISYDYLNGGGRVSGQNGNEGEQQLLIGPRFGIFAADGEPANDIMMGGISGRYRLNNNWLFGLAVDYAEFDFERPYRLLNMHSQGENDASASNTIISAWAEREFGGDSQNNVKPFVSGGIGIGITDIDDVKGNLAGGGTYDITTDGGTEIIPSLGAGLRFKLGNQWKLEVGARADYHIADWDINDRNSGRATSLDDYLTLGGYLSLIFDF